MRHSKDRFYILARHHGEACGIARAYNLEPGQWRYILSTHELRGLRGARVLMSACWADYPRKGVEVAELRAYLRSHEARLTSVGCA